MTQTTSRRARVAIIEDHLLPRARTEELLARTEAYELVFSGASEPEFLDWLRETQIEERPHLL